MPPKSCSYSILILFLSIPASFAQAADSSPGVLSELEIKPVLIWIVSAIALILSIAAFFVPPARRAMVSTIVLATLAGVGIWKNWHVGVFDLLSGAATLSANADVIKGLILAGAMILAILFLLTAYLLVLTWGRGGYVLMGVVSIFGVWGILAHTEILPNTMIWEALPNQMGSVGFLLSVGSTLGFVLSGLVIAFGGGGKSGKTSDGDEKSTETEPEVAKAPEPPASKPLPKEVPAPSFAANEIPKPIPASPSPTAIPAPGVKPVSVATPAPTPPKTVEQPPKPAAIPAPTTPRPLSPQKPAAVPAPAVAAKVSEPPKTSVSTPISKPTPVPQPAATPKPGFGVVSAKPVLAVSPGLNSSTVEPRKTPLKVETSTEVKRAEQVALPAPAPPKPSVPVSVLPKAPQKPAQPPEAAEAAPKVSTPPSRPVLSNQTHENIDHLRKHQQDRIRSKTAGKGLPTISPAELKAGVSKPSVTVTAKAKSNSEVAPELERSTNVNSGQESISWKMKNGVWSRG